MNIRVNHCECRHLNHKNCKLHAHTLVWILKRSVQCKLFVVQDHVCHECLLSYNNVLVSYIMVDVPQKIIT